MQIKEIKIQETVLCYNCRKAWMVTGWEPNDILKNECPNCKQRKLFWAVKEKKTEEQEDGR